jgi:two-component system alkaline phosphatase synthesis response regulator PhoP
MDEHISVLILGENTDITNRLQVDLDMLGFKAAAGGYPVTDTDNGTFKPPVDVVLIDLTVYDRGVLSVCELLLREETLPPETGLIALVSETSMGQIPLDYKFADVVRFPYDIAELSFRLRRVTHLHRRDFAKDTIRIGGLSLSPSRYEVKVDGHPVVMSHKEYELFKFLITHPNRVFTREKLLTSIWGHNLMGGGRTIDVHIRRVRAKIGDIDQMYIKTVRGVGYAFRFRESA